jgi:chemotaxis protein MotB
VENDRAQAAQIETLRLHSRNVEDQLKRTEEELALANERAGLERRQSANYRREAGQIREQFLGVVNSRFPISPETSQRLAALAQKHPGLKFDLQTGIAKLETDILFDDGSAELKPGAEKALAEVVRLLNAPEAQDLRVLVAGHTDDRAIAKKPAREKYPDNFHLSTERALAVLAELRRLGLADARIGAAGFGSHQPIAPNLTPKDRQKNRRVELFVLAPEVPVVGWSETTPRLY